MEKILILCVVCAFFFFLVYGQSSKNGGGWETTDVNGETKSFSAAKALEQKLFSGYSKIARPVKDSKQPINVTYRFILNQLLHLNEQEQKMKITVWQVREWVDEFLEWDPLKFNNITDIRVSPEDIWIPDLVVTNAVELSEVPVKVKVQHTGAVTWDSSYVLVTSCMINVKYFPYDKQLCHILIGSWTFPMNELNLSPENASASVNLDYYVENDEWMLTNTSISTLFNQFPGYDEPLMELCFRLSLVRRPGFYELNIIFPSTLIYFCVLSVFLLPCESGEKIGLNITILLSLAVNNVRISESMPPSSKNSPVIGHFFIAQITMVTLAIFCNALVLTLFHRSRHHTRVPHPVRRLVSLLPGYKSIDDRDFNALRCSVRRESHSLQVIYNSNNGLPNVTALTPNGVSSHGRGSNSINSPFEGHCHDPKGPKRGDNPKERPETQASLLEARRRLNNVCNDSFQRNYGKIADCLGQIDSFLLKYESAQINEREWKRLAYIFDKVFATFFSIVALIMGAIFKLSYVDTARDLIINDQWTPDLCAAH